MRYIFLAIKVVIVLLFGANLFFWMVVHASSHRIPEGTKSSILVFGVFLIVVFIGVSFLNRRRKKRFEE